VVSKSKRSITIAYNNTPPYLAYQKNIRLDLFANDITFQRMQEALQKAGNMPLLQNKLITKIDLLQDTASTSTLKYNQSTLNKSQQQAIHKSIQQKEVFLIHGPPGTGKTTTLAESILQLTALKKKVLVTAPSNTAVDNLLEKMTNLGVKCVRIGNPTRMNESLLQHSLDVKLQDSPDYQTANSYWNKIQILQKEQKEYLPATGQNRRGLEDEAILRQAKIKKPYRGITHAKLRKMAKWIELQREINKCFELANELQQKAIDELLEHAQVVCSTNASAGSDLLKDIKFDVVCVDEATQATEPETLIPLVKGEKWILAGDHKQLPPTVKSDKATALRISLFERLMHLNDDYISQMLNIQYRMHAMIMKFSNEQFYKHQLSAHPSISQHTLADLAGYSPFNNNPFIANAITNPDEPIVFLDYKNGLETKMEGSFSYYNPEEINIVQQVADALLSSRLFPDDIGIISPYDQQVSRLKSRMRDYQIEIKSIDGFQGREKEVIILSLVRSNENGNIGFLRDYRRLNVALTRAKRKLIIIGNRKTLEKDAMYDTLIKSVIKSKSSVE